MKWFIKIFAKIIIRKLPISYTFWKFLGLFRHGKMDSCNYAIKIFNLHFNRAFTKKKPIQIKILELGPGDSIASAIIAYAHGVSRIYLVDVGKFATKNLDFYKKLANKLKSDGLPTPDLTNISSIEEILKLTNSVYLTNGLSSLKLIKSLSLDFVWSHSVLEHIPKNEFLDIQKEINRVLKKSGRASHNIDFQDHLDHGLNNLRFSENIWESRIFVNSGFYTNRIPAVKMISIFKKVGFDIEHQSFGKWPKLPISRSNIHKDFNIYSNSDLKIRTAYVLLKK